MTSQHPKNDTLEQDDPDYNFIVNTIAWSRGGEVTNEDYVKAEEVLGRVINRKVLEAQIELLDEKLPQILGYNNITPTIAARGSDYIEKLEAGLSQLRGKDER